MHDIEFYFMNIKYWQNTQDYENHRHSILDLVDQTFASGQLILGPHVSAFEDNFSAYCGVNSGVGVNSGTDALFLSLKALGIKAGDEVITVSNTAVPTVAAIRAAGAMPIFVDVEENTYLMDVQKLESCVSEKTVCVIPVHLFGQPVDMDPLLAFCCEHHLNVIEDCAQSTGALYKKKKVGSLGDCGAFSFYPTKILGAFGDGGMVVTDDKKLFQKLKKLRFYGIEDSYCANEEGFNSRLDEVQAALLNFKLSHLEEQIVKRNNIALSYYDALRSTVSIKLPVTKNDRTHSYYTYTITAQKRDQLKQYLSDEGIETKINYPTPIHLMPGYQFLGYKEGELPVTEQLSKQILSLPIYPDMSSRQVGYICDKIIKFYG